MFNYYKNNYSGRKLTKIPDECSREISGGSSLFNKSLNLSKNEITQVNSREIYHLIETIDFSSNKISLISFENLTNLKQIFLSKNVLEKIQETSFRNLSKLRLLKLNHNQIKNFHLGTFKTLFNLTEIDLSNNNIKSVDFSIFKDQYHKLKRLDLSSNKIEKIDSKCLLIFEKLEFLDLSSNDIEKFALVLLNKNFIINLSFNKRLKFNLAGFEFIKYAKDISVNKCRQIILNNLKNLVCNSNENALKSQLEHLKVDL